MISVINLTQYGYGMRDCDRRRRKCATLRKPVDMEGAIICRHACALGCECIVSKRLGSHTGLGSDHWLKIKNPAAAVQREAEDWR